VPVRLEPLTRRAHRADAPERRPRIPVKDGRLPWLPGVLLQQRDRHNRGVRM